MGLVSVLSLTNHSDPRSFLVVCALLSQDGFQWEGFWEVDRMCGLASLFSLIIYLISCWLCWVFVAASRLSLVVVSCGATLCCGARASHCGGFSCCGAQALEHLSFSSCGSWALKCGLSPKPWASTEDHSKVNLRGLLCRERKPCYQIIMQLATS